MKYILPITLISLALNACGGDTSNTEQVSAAKKQSEKITACSILTDSYIKKEFPSASEIKNEGSHIPDSQKDRYCVYSYKNNGEKYGVSLNLFAAKSPYADKALLESKVKYMTGSELIPNVGEIAYYSKKMGVLTALGNKSVVQVTAYSKDSNDADKQQALTTKVAVGLLKELK